MTFEEVFLISLAFVLLSGTVVPFLLTAGAFVTRAVVVWAVITRAIFTVALSVVEVIAVAIILAVFILAFFRVLEFVVVHATWGWFLNTDRAALEGPLGSDWRDGVVSLSVLSSLWSYLRACVGAGILTSR
jgi:hypothetical protein